MMSILIKGMGPKRQTVILVGCLNGQGLVKLALLIWLANLFVGFTLPT